MIVIIKLNCYVIAEFLEAIERGMYFAVVNYGLILFTLWKTGKLNQRIRDHKTNEHNII